MKYFLAMAVLAGASEAAGGALLAAGLAVPLAAATIVGVMANAVGSVHWGKGPWVTNGGWELPVTYATVAVALPPEQREERCERRVWVSRPEPNARERGWTWVR